MAVNYFSQNQGPTYTHTNESTDTTGATVGNTAGSSMNQYTAGQQALQGQAGNFMSNILAGGSVPQNFGMPQVVYDAAMANFNQYQAPKLASQFGAGSPAINASMQDLQLQLAGQASTAAMGNALDAFQQASSYAFNPVGQDTTGTSTTNTTGTSTGTKDAVNVYTGGLLGDVGYILGGGFQSIFS